MYSPSMDSFQENTFIRTSTTTNEEDKRVYFDAENPKPFVSNENTVMETKRSNQSKHNTDTMVRVLAPSTLKQMNLAVSSTNPEGVAPAKKTVHNQITSNTCSTEVANFWDTKNTKMQIDADNIETRSEALQLNSIHSSVGPQIGWGFGLCFMVLLGFFLFNMIFLLPCCNHSANQNKDAETSPNTTDAETSPNTTLISFSAVGGLIIICMFIVIVLKWTRNWVRLFVSALILFSGIICWIIFCRYEKQKNIKPPTCITKPIEFVFKIELDINKFTNLMWMFGLEYSFVGAVCLIASFILFLETII